MKIFVRVFVVSLVGLFVSYQTIRSVDHEFLFDKEVNFLYAVIAGITFLTIGIFDAIEFKATRNWRAFLPSLVGLILLTLHFFILNKLKQRDHSPSQMYCVSKGNDFNGISIDFRKDGTYKLTSWCLGADIYRGTFTIQDSIIIISRSPKENALVSNRLVIRQDSPQTQEQSVYQIDHEGKAIRNATAFSVVADKGSERK